MPGRGVDCIHGSASEVCALQGVEIDKALANIFHMRRQRA
jgi:hypothetical protein